MKRNSFSSLKLVAILLSMLMFTACNKTEFTAQDALDLELARLTRAREIEAEREAFVASQAEAAHSYRKVLDSLQRVNAGGLVYYSVAVVPGGGSVFSGGRTEGLSGATVTISQFGQNVAVTTDASGIASFPDLRSGEVNVSISIDGFTDMNYLANLTPDGGVANNASVYVGNVLPVFETDETNPENLAKMAFIKGRGFAELDITYGNDTEEIVPSGTTIASYIDVNPSFWTKYLAEANEEGNDAFPGNTGTQQRKSGYIQRVSYQQAGKVATYDASGDYTLMVPATGSGLPTTMRYSEFATDRTYFDDDNGDLGFGTGTNDSDFGVVSKRFIYGPNVTPTPIILTGVLAFNGFPLPFFDFNDQDAAITVSLTNEGSLASISVTNAGLYLVVPTVTISGNGTGATATVTLEASPVDANTKLRAIKSINITAAGSGYSTATVTVNRVASGIVGTVRQESATGGLSGTVRIIDGGFGFTSGSINTTSFSSIGDWTGINPHINIPNGFTGNLPSLTFTYDFSNTTNGSFDIVSQIVASGGTQWGASSLADLNSAPFRYVINDAVLPNVDADGDALFIVTGSALGFNGAYGEGGNTIAGLGLVANNVLNLTGGLVVNGLTVGSGYVFVPSILLQNMPAGAAGASLTATVTKASGAVTAVTLVGGTGFTTATAKALQATVVDPTNALDAEFFLEGSGIQAYDITSTPATYASYLAEAKAGAGGLFTDPETNTVMTAAGADNLNSFVALAGVATGGLSPRQAYGYPVFDDPNGNIQGTTQSQVIGIELVDGGNGYDGAGSNFSWELVPVYGSRTKWTGTGSASINGSKLAFTLTNGGSGYATAPNIVVTGGGALLGSPNTPLASDFTFWINNSGTITKVVEGYNARVGSGIPYTATSVAADPIVATLSTQDQAFGMTLGFFTGMQVGPFIDFTITGGSLTNYFTTFYPNFKGEVRDMIFGFFPYNGIPEIVAYADAFGNPIARNSFAVPPTVTIVDLRGFGSGATADVILDPTDGEIIDLNVTNGGSGYTITFETNSSYISAEGFRVLGGPDGNINAGVFEVYSGISYARDIHYGTGLELE